MPNHDMKTNIWREKQYIQNERSISDIAEELSVPKSTLRRQLIKDGTTLRSKSEAQAVALHHGRSEHPTEGKKRPESVRIAISDGVSQSIQNLSEEERTRRSDMARKQWENMTQAQRDELLKLARDAARETSKTGSKLEKFIRDGLTKAGFKVDYHREGLITNVKLQIDMYLPEVGIAIEIDGPSHFFPIWGEANLRRNQRADSHKTGLLLEKGFVLIRVKQLQKSVSNKLQRGLLDAVLNRIRQVQRHKPDKYSRLIEIEVQ